MTIIGFTHCQLLLTEFIQENVPIIMLLTALMPLIFIRAVEAIIIAITDIDTRNTVSIIACEQITKACPTFRLAVLWRFIRSISTVIITITIPCRWDATVIWAPTYNVTGMLLQIDSNQTQNFLFITYVTNVQVKYVSEKLTN